MSGKVVNPLTNRKIKVNGALHKKLCKDVRVNIAGCPEKKEKKAPRKRSKKSMKLFQKISKKEQDEINDYVNKLFEIKSKMTKEEAKKDEKNIQKVIIQYGKDLEEAKKFKKDYPYDNKLTEALISKMKKIFKKLDSKFEPRSGMPGFSTWKKIEKIYPDAFNLSLSYKMRLEEIEKRARIDRERAEEKKQKEIKVKPQEEKTIKIKIVKKKPPAPKKEKTIKIKIKKIKKVKEEIKQEEKKPILPMPSVQTLKQVIEDKKKLKQNKPVYYSSALTIQPFMLLHILEENKNDCTLGFTTYEKFESLSPYYIGFTNSGNIKGVQQFRKNEIDKIIDKYKECAKNNKILLILVNLPGHTNILFINPVRKEMELFEPHGKLSEKTFWLDRIENMGKNIKKEIVEKFNKKLKEKFTYVSTQSSCPAFQTFEGKFKKESRREGGIIIKDPRGWCTAWSFFYADLRFKFPEMSQDQLIRESMEILTEDPRELREFIRGQWMFIYDKAEELYKGGFITTHTRAKGKKREIYYKTFQEATKVWKKWLTEQFKKYSN